MKSLLRRLMATALAKAKGNFDFPGPERDGWGNRFAMDARTKIESRLPSRHVTKGPSRALHRSYLGASGLTASDEPTNAAPHSAITHKHEIKFGLLDVAEIFKKTSCVAGLKPGGRYVAKDMREIGSIIEIDADVMTLNVKLTGAELAEHETKSKPRETNGSGALWGYAQQVGRAVDGAVTHPGGAYEKQCHADI